MTKEEKSKANITLKETRKAAKQLGYSKEILNTLNNITIKLTDSYNSIISEITRQMINGRRSIPE